MGLILAEVGASGDWAAAARLLAEHRRWVADALDLDLTAAHPDADVEFTDPANFYRPPHGVLVMAKAGWRPVGVVGVHRYAGEVGELKRMYVSPAGRGRGAGRALLAAAVAAAADLGLAELWLQTEPEAMSVAYRLYREAGFVDIPPYHDLGVPGVATLGMRVPGRALTG